MSLKAAFCPKFTEYSNSAKHQNKYFVELITTGDVRSLFANNPIFPNKRETDCNTLLFRGFGLCDILSMNFIYWAVTR